MILGRSFPKATGVDYTFMFLVAVAMLSMIVCHVHRVNTVIKPKRWIVLVAMAVVTSFQVEVEC